jgi:hypothetical protein
MKTLNPKLLLKISLNYATKFKPEVQDLLTYKLVPVLIAVSQT